MNYLLGHKLGMTRVFDESGRMVPVTAIQISNNVVAGVRTEAKDGYNAVIVGSDIKKHPSKPQTGAAKALSAVPAVLREFRVEEPDQFKVGEALGVEGVEKGQLFKLIGVSKGKGFSGVIKRHNFRRGPETHGSDHHRHPGSIGAMFPQHVTKGHRMPGRMGNDQCTIRKVKIVDILLREQIILVKGPVPGSRGALVEMEGM